MRSAVLRSVLSFGVLCLASAATSGEITYRKHIKPVFDARCATCHGRDAAPELGAFKENKARWMAKGRGMRMNTYSHLVFYVAWPDTGALMRRLDDGTNTKDGKPGNMHDTLGSTQAERARNLTLFKQWVGNWTLKRRKQITKEELEAIKATY